MLSTQVSKALLSTCKAQLIVSAHSKVPRPIRSVRRGLGWVNGGSSRQAHASGHVMHLKDEALPKMIICISHGIGMHTYTHTALVCIVSIVCKDACLWILFKPEQSLQQVQVRL